MTKDYPTIEIHHDCGYIYVGKIRMGFSPIRSLRKGGEKFKNSNGLLLWASIPTASEIQTIIKEMKKAFPDREIFIDVQGGPILV